MHFLSYLDSACSELWRVHLSYTKQIQAVYTLPTKRSTYFGAHTTCKFSLNEDQLRATYQNRLHVYKKNRPTTVPPAGCVFNHSPVFFSLKPFGAPLLCVFLIATCPHFINRLLIPGPRLTWWLDYEAYSFTDLKPHATKNSMLFIPALLPQTHHFRGQLHHTKTTRIIDVGVGDPTSFFNCSLSTSNSLAKLDLALFTAALLLRGDQVPTSLHRVQLVYCLDSGAGDPA